MKGWRRKVLYGIATLLLMACLFPLVSQWLFVDPTSSQGKELGAASTGLTDSPARTEPTSFAFLVGVRSYQFPNGQVDLQFTESDVDELSRALNRNGWDRKNIQLLTQWAQADNSNLAPTADNIRRQLKQMLAKCIPGDTILMMVTGMGGEAGDDRYCYLPADANFDQTKTLIHLDEFYELLADCRASRKVLLIDTCQTTSLKSFQWPHRPIPNDLSVLMACSPKQLSYEHPKLRHGVFSYFLLRALEGEADRNQDHRVDLGELLSFTKTHVQEFLDKEKPDAKQTPILIGNLPLSTPIVSKSSLGQKEDAL